MGSSSGFKERFSRDAEEVRRKALEELKALLEDHKERMRGETARAREKALKQITQLYNPGT